MERTTDHQLLPWYVKYAFTRDQEWKKIFLVQCPFPKIGNEWISIYVKWRSFHLYNGSNCKICTRWVIRVSRITRGRFIQTTKKSYSRILLVRILEHNECFAILASRRLCNFYCQNPICTKPHLYEQIFRSLEIRTIGVRRYIFFISHRSYQQSINFFITLRLWTILYNTTVMKKLLYYSVVRLQRITDKRIICL